jgi:tetratricopeptide (TPR) repeat protein
VEDSRNLRIATILATVILIAMTIGTILRNHVWRSEVSLWEDVTAKSPNKARGYVILGVAYKNSGKLNQAIEMFKRADEVARAYPQRQNPGAVALANLGGMYLDYGGELMWPEADRVLERARNTYPADHIVLANSVEALMRLQEVERANGLADAAIATFPDSAVLHFMKGDVLAVMGDCAGAEKHRETSRQFDPTLFFPPRECHAF